MRFLHVFLTLLLLPMGSIHSSTEETVLSLETKLFFNMDQCGALKNPNRAPVRRLIRMNESLINSRSIPSKEDINKLEDLDSKQAYCGILYDFILKNLDEYLSKTQLPSRSNSSDSTKLLQVFDQCSDLKDPNRGPVQTLIKINKNIVNKRQIPSQKDVKNLADINFEQAYCGLLFDFILEYGDVYSSSQNNEKLLKCEQDLEQINLILNNYTTNQSGVSRNYLKDIMKILSPRIDTGNKKTISR